jgi:hypothetical protein
MRFFYPLYLQHTQYFLTQNQHSFSGAPICSQERAAGAAHFSLLLSRSRTTVLPPPLPETMSEYDKEVGVHKPGSIQRVKLNNFLTYSSVEFFPGPR